MSHLAKTLRWVIVDGNESPKKTWNQIEAHLKELEMIELSGGVVHNQ